MAIDWLYVFVSLTLAIYSKTSMGAHGHNVWVQRITKIATHHQDRVRKIQMFNRSFPSRGLHKDKAFSLLAEKPLELANRSSRALLPEKLADLSGHRWMPRDVVCHAHTE